MTNSGELTSATPSLPVGYWVTSYKARRNANILLVYSDFHKHTNLAILAIVQLCIIICLHSLFALCDVSKCLIRCQ